MSEKIVYKGTMIEVVCTPMPVNGKEIIWERCRRGPGVRLIIERPDGGFLIITEEGRFGIGLDYKLPGGKVFDSLDEYNEFLSTQKSDEDILEKAEEAVIREGIEEAGIKPTEFEFFSISKCGGSMEWDLYYFIVKKYEEVGQKIEWHEDITVLKVSREKLENLIFSDKMKEDRSVAMILKYLHKKDGIKNS